MKCEIGVLKKTPRLLFDPIKSGGLEREGRWMLDFPFYLIHRSKASDLQFYLILRTRKPTDSPQRQKTQKKNGKKITEILWNRFSPLTPPTPIRERVGFNFWTGSYWNGQSQNNGKSIFVENPLTTADNVCLPCLLWKCRNNPFFLVGHQILLDSAFLLRMEQQITQTMQLLDKLVRPKKRVLQKNLAPQKTLSQQIFWLVTNWAPVVTSKFLPLIMVMLFKSVLLLCSSCCCRCCS